MRFTGYLQCYFRATVLVLCGVFIPALMVSASDIVVGSWNIQRLGHGDHKSYPALAAIASKVDLLAVQEVMTEEGLERLRLQLEKRTGEPWGHLKSHALGDNSYKEMYGFLWRESTVEYSEGAVVYLDRGNRFAREPYSAKFRSLRDGSELAVGTVHIVFGKSVKDRTPEIKALADYWLWMKEVYPDAPIVLMGDFNLPPSHDAWASMKRVSVPLITRGATTLSSKEGRYANLYDNIWVEPRTTLAITDAGIIDFPKMIGWSHEKSRRHVSDHAPIYMTLGNASLAGDAGKAAARPAASDSASKATEGGIRGNRNSKIYHRSDCPSYNRMADKNRVGFADARAAESSGYRLARNCP